MSTSTDTPRKRALAALHYEPYDQLPLVHFGFWSPETLGKWADEGHISRDLAANWHDGNEYDREITRMLGFDMNWTSTYGAAYTLVPAFESKVIRELPDGSRHVRNQFGVIELQKDDAGSIPAEIDHMLKDRASWEEHYLPRLQYSNDRVTTTHIRTPDGVVRYDQGGLEYLQQDHSDKQWPVILHCGSLFGVIRNMLGIENASYLQVDDEDLFDEIIETIGGLAHRCVEKILADGAKFDVGHFWEDICFRNGPLISPRVFDEKVGPQYKRITKMLNQHGIDIVSLDCDGKIDALLPTWLQNGVNTMFPIEVGTWDASISPWREQYGKGLLGVGGMDKRVFAHDKAAVDAEIERLKPLVELGGYIPCPDHRIPPDARWELVLYYTERMRATFS